jgi:cell division protein FtsZ
VQQACSIIQGAAHEDANIIFGAVMDEKMKDAVKITVIATGFRKEAAERRNRMLDGALRTSVVPHIESRPAMPRFASEDFEEQQTEVTTRREYTPIIAAEPAFEERAAPMENRSPLQFDEPEAFSSAPDPVSVIIAEPPTPVAEPGIFADPHQDENAENLDIPAFMRRGGI